MCVCVYGTFVVGMYVCLLNFELLLLKMLMCIQFMQRPDRSSFPRL